MYRLIIFSAGFALAALALPEVQSHHLRSELLQLAWCSSSGLSPSQPTILGMHCVWCPALLTGVAAMIVSPFLGQLRTLKHAFRRIAP